MVSHTFEPTKTARAKFVKLDSSIIMRQIKETVANSGQVGVSPLERLSRSSSVMSFRKPDDRSTERALKSPAFKIRRNSATKIFPASSRSEYQLFGGSPQKDSSDATLGITSTRFRPAVYDTPQTTEAADAASGPLSFSFAALNDERQKVRRVFPEFKVQGLKDFSRYPLESLDPGWDPRIDYNFLIKDHPRALSRFTTEKGQVVWRPCTVLHYDKETHEFTIVWDKEDGAAQNSAADTELSPVQVPKRFAFSREVIRAKMLDQKKFLVQHPTALLPESQEPEQKVLTKKVRKLNLILHGESIPEQETIRKESFTARCLNLLSLSLKDAILHDKPAPDVRVLFPSSSLERIRIKGGLSFEQMETAVDEILDCFMTNVVEFYVQYHEVQRLEDFQAKFRCGLGAGAHAVDVASMNILSFVEHINEEYIEDETLTTKDSRENWAVSHSENERGLVFSRYSRPFIGFLRQQKAGADMGLALRHSVSSYLGLNADELASNTTSGGPNETNTSTRKMSRKHSMENVVLPRECRFI